VGGGYTEEESALAKYPLRWMIDEAAAHGLIINKALYNHLVLGTERDGGSRHYVAPDAAGPVHNSMNAGWRILEWLPKRARRIEWPKRRGVLGWYLPRVEPRPIAHGALVHASVADRMSQLPDYKPINLPAPGKYVVEP
jgi:uncharacterized protein (DUF2235 family)